MRRLYPSIRSDPMGHCDQFRSLSIIKDELFETHGSKVMLNEYESAAARSLHNDREVPSHATSNLNQGSRAVQPSRNDGKFFDLPGEVRNKIYELVLNSGVVFKISMLRLAGGTNTHTRSLSSFLRLPPARSAHLRPRAWQVEDHAPGSQQQHPGPLVR